MSSGLCDNSENALEPGSPSRIDGSLRGRIALLTLVSVGCSCVLSAGHLACTACAAVFGFVLKYSGPNWWDLGRDPRLEAAPLLRHSASWIDNDWFLRMHWLWKAQSFFAGNYRELIINSLGVSSLINAATFGVAYLTTSVLCWLVPWSRPGLRSLWRRPAGLRVRRTLGWAALLGAGWALCSHEVGAAVGNLEPELSLPGSVAVTLAGLLGTGSALGAILQRMAWLDTATTRCRLCGYELAGIQATNCPECGELRRQLEHRHSARTAAAWFSTTRRLFVVGALVAIVLACLRVGSGLNYLRQGQSSMVTADFWLSRPVLVDSPNHGAWLLQFAKDTAAAAAEPNRVQADEVPLVMTATRVEAGVRGETVSLHFWVPVSPMLSRQYVAGLGLGIRVYQTTGWEECVSLTVFDQSTTIAVP